MYLSGPISGLTYGGATDWREYVTQCFPPFIQGVSPMRAKPYLNDGSVLGCADQYPFPLSTDRAINTRDRMDTLRSSAMFVNLLGAKVGSLGTAMEIAWAFDHKIPIICAMEPAGNPHDHPMIRDCVSIRVGSLHEAIEATVAVLAPHEKHIWNRIEQTEMLREENRLDLRQPPAFENYDDTGRTQ